MSEANDHSEHAPKQPKPHAHAPVSARPRSPRQARRIANKDEHAQRRAADYLALAAARGVDPLPILPPGVRASTRAFLEERLRQGNGALSLALADRLISEALDPSSKRSIDAARLTLEQTEDARVKRTETTQRSARIVLSIDGRTPATPGGTMEFESGPMAGGASSSSAPFPPSLPPFPSSSPPSPSLPRFPSPLPPVESFPPIVTVSESLDSAEESNVVEVPYLVRGGPVESAVGPMPEVESLAGRVAKLEEGQAEMLSLLRGLAGRLSGG